MRTTAIPALGILQINGGEWRAISGLPLPIGGDEWLAKLAEIDAETRLLEQFPDHHIIQGEEHDLVIRSTDARRFIEQNWPELLRGLMLAVARLRDSGRLPEGENAEGG